MTTKILFVDDDQNVLQSFKRQLRKLYDIETALCGDEGLKAIAQQGPFAVVVSDMQMPGMNGVEFLKKVQELDRDTIRIMLTGNADQRTATEAVNEGHIFRFLNKPCSAEQMMKTLDAGLEQYRLVTAERELLSKTLSGSVGVLTEVLSLAKPRAFWREAEVRALVRQLCERAHIDNAWQVELAASLAHLGHIAVPESILDRVKDGLPLNEHDQCIYDSHPAVGSRLVSKIPRLGSVAQLIADQAKPFDDEDIPVGARILKLALDFDEIRAAGQSDEQALAAILNRPGMYDPILVDTLKALVRSDCVFLAVAVAELCEGMVLEENVIGESGEALIGKGRRITPVLLARLRSYAQQRAVREPIRVRLSIADAEQPPEDGGDAEQAGHIILAALADRELEESGK